jgi:hypothetical protein
LVISNEEKMTESSEVPSRRKYIGTRLTSCLPALISAAFFINAIVVCAQAEPSGGVPAIRKALPDAPDAMDAVEPGKDQAPPPSPNGNCAVSGTILDTNGDVVQGAQVVLRDHSGGGKRKMQSGLNGQFMFAALPPGSYEITVTGKGMSTFVSPWFMVHPGESRIMSSIVLAVATATSSITVTGNSEELKEELSERQVQIAVEQRVWGVFPNFYSSYDWNAPPMKPKQKFQLAFRSMMDPMAFAGAAGIAGFEQYYDIFPGYGGGPPGYFKRFGAAYTNDFSARMLSSGVFATLFHQDPRYFYKGTGSFESRATYAVSCAFVTRNDSGRWRPNYSHVLGVFAAAALSNLYYPKENRGLTLTLVNGAVETAGNAGTNIIREFILKGITSHAGGRP